VSTPDTIHPAALRSRPRSLPVLTALLFGSGASALIYQVLWLRLLSLVFGVTVYAATAVLASFMAGLALGSALAGRLADRVRSPLRWFGLVEIGIGVLAFATQWLFAAATPTYIHLQAWLADGFLARSALRFVGSFIVLIGPTTLMGMTLPLVLKAAVQPAANSGRRISVLYAANTAGAVAGALLAGFYLVGTLGISSSFRLAAMTNVLVGIAACVLSMTDSATRSRGKPALHVPIGPPEAAARLPRTAIAVFALSGFAALALEVVWFRVLVYFVPATSYAFSTMLAAVLVGLAAGSFAATPLLARSDRLLQRLGWLQLGTALAVPLAATALAAAYRAGWHATADVHVSVILAFPPAFLMGMSYPIGLHAWAGGGRSDVRLDATKIGDLNSVNLLGGILGAIAGGFIILPVFGSRTGLAVLSAVYLVSFFLLLREIKGTRWQRTLMVLAPAAFFLAALDIPDMLEAVSGRRYPAGERLFWWQEGAQTTAAVRIRPYGGRLLYLNGLHQASDAPEMVRLHRLIGHLPMALHPQPKRAIVIGLGGGATPGAVSQHDATVDLVELSPSVVEAAAWFSHINYDLLNRSNIRLRIDDGRNFLLSASGRYDVLTADLIQPEHAGAGNLYSREYFALVRSALAPGGLVLQWIGHRSEVEYKLILRTFLDVFPATTLWADGQLLVGALAPLVIQREAFERKLQRPETQQALQAIDLDSFERLLRLYIAGPEELRTFVGPGQLLTDDRPLVEYFRSLPPDGRSAVDLSSLTGDVSRHVR
jgi:spermidine synthase